MATRTVDEQAILDRIVANMRSQKAKQKDLCEHLGGSSQMFTNWKNGNNSSYMKCLPQIADFLGVTVNDLLGKTNNPIPRSEQIKEYLPFEKRGSRPIIGIASAGTGIFADEEILGWQSVDEAYDNDECFWLKVAGDSMSPKIDDGDLVLIQRDAEIESGNIAVVVVDGMDGFIKRVELNEDGITLCSYNPYYPDLMFKGADVKRVHFIGRARKIERDL